MAVQVVVPVVTQTIAVADICDPWWLYDGILPADCVFAYQPYGAASYAASLVNLNNPGTYDASEGVAPTWAYGTGWSFNGSSQYLNTGYSPPDEHLTVIIRIANSAVGDNASAFGWYNTSVDAVSINPADSSGHSVFSNAATLDIGVSGGALLGISDRVCFTTKNRYTLDAAGALSASYISIGRSSWLGGGRYWEGDLLAMAMYNRAMSESEIQALIVSIGQILAP